MQIVATLQHYERPLADLLEDPSHVRETDRRDTDATDRVTQRRIETCRDYHQVWVELFDYGQEKALASVDVVSVSDESRLVLLYVERPLDIVSETGSSSCSLMLAQRPGVELTRVEPVYAYVQHTRVIVENTGRPVAHVHVPVKNNNFLHTFCVVPLRDSCRDPHIIEKAKATDRCRMRVVPWGPHTRKRVVNSGLAAHCLHGLDCAPRRHVSRLGRTTIGIRIVGDVLVFQVFQLGAIDVGASLIDLLQVLLAVTE